MKEWNYLFIQYAKRKKNAPCNFMIFTLTRIIEVCTSIRLKCFNSVNLRPHLTLTYFSFFLNVHSHTSIHCNKKMDLRTSFSFPFLYSGWCGELFFLFFFPFYPERSKKRRPIVPSIVACTNRVWSKISCSFSVC